MKLKYNIQFFAAGKVCTGFSKPYVANYSANAGVVTYSNARKLARGVSISMTPDSGSDNDFYADNQLSESEGGSFSSATATLTVDGLFIDAERQIMGLPEADSSGWTAYGDGQNTPNMGLGFIARYMSDGITTFTPIILCKVKFNQVPISAQTQGQNIDWQTEELNAKVMRGDDAAKTWKYIGSEYTTEDEAEKALQVKFGIYVTSPYMEAAGDGVSMFGTLVSDLQDNIIVSGSRILGNLKYYDDPDSEIVQAWHEGNFIALQWANFDPRATSVRVGLRPTYPGGGDTPVDNDSGLVEIINDPDKNGVFKITDKETQNFIVVTSDGTHVTRESYDLAGLTVESGD